MDYSSRFGFSKDLIIKGETVFDRSSRDTEGRTLTDRVHAVREGDRERTLCGKGVKYFQTLTSAQKGNINEVNCKRCLGMIRSYKEES